jgi:hypothetical protein
VVYILEDKEIHMEAASIILWIIYLISHVLASADLKYDDYLCARCNKYPAVARQHILPDVPAVISTEHVNYVFDAFPNVKGYRFINPAGIIFNGVAAKPEGLTNVILISPSLPSSEATWFLGYSWKILYTPGCTNGGHMGWAFYLENNPDIQFVFLVLDGLKACSDLNERVEFEVATKPNRTFARSQSY